MPDLTPGQQALSSLWGALSAAFRDPALRSRPGGLTQYAWEAFRQSYLSRGETPPPATLQDMNGVMSRIGQEYRASVQAASALASWVAGGRDSTITSSMFAPDVDSRALQDQPLGPNYRVRFEVTFNIEGESIPQWLTWSPGLSLPASMSHLEGVLTEAAGSLAQDYGYEFEGLTGNLSITTV